MEKMDEALTEAALMKRIATVGLAEWGLYTVLVVRANQRTTATDLAALLGTTDRTITRYLNKLVQCGLIRLDKQTTKFVESTILALYNISFNVHSSLDVKDITADKIDDPPQVPLLAYWCNGYEQRYGTKYRPSNWARDQRSLKLLDAKYGDRLRPIMDVILRLYETRWYSQSYPRPTLGSMVSWLAAQADGYVTLPDVTQPVVVDLQNVSLADFDAKFGLSVMGGDSGGA
jgi:DNA-binding transcriptional ArsR family regulator